MLTSVESIAFNSNRSNIMPQKEEPSNLGVGIVPQANMITADSVKISGGTFTMNNMIGDPLDKLKHVSSSGIHALDEEGCMEGTRVSLLNDLQQWSMDVTTPPIFWLDGMAGTGKSAIARSFCRFLHGNRRLGGSFFCLRGHESRANVKRILPTLAWFLARQDSQYQTTLLGILQDAPDVADYSIKRQVEFLLETPLRGVSVNEQRPPLVLAIDALDECGDAEEVKQLLNKLLAISKDLPVKFFLTSRPERHIVAYFESSQSLSESHRILRLHDIEQDLVEADILLYLNRQLTVVRSLSGSPSMFPPDWPALDDILTLTRFSGKLFIYAFTAVKYIAAKNHVKRLQTLTKLTSDNHQPFHGPLDKMYSLVLSVALDPNECTAEEICMTKRILGAIIVLREPLNLSDLARLLIVAPDDIWENTDRIRAVVNVPPSGKDGVVATFHASFADFLTTSGRAPENMRITPSTAHRDLANGSLKIMNSSLRFNIAGCRTSYLFNSEQELATISVAVKYASLHWAYHMDTADDATSLLSNLETFLYEKFLFWLEVLSASGMGSRASSIISRALQTAKRCMTEDIHTFLYDANHFAVAFREVIESSVAHIYLSALPSVHKTSKISEVFMAKYPFLMKIHADGIPQQRRPLLELRGHTSSVVSVGFSPDGTHIVSGSVDKSIRIWDAKTGEEVMKPLNGHTDSVNSVGFSPDGACIVSGSWDDTIRIWDARTGKEIMKPLRGHTSMVASVSFSPDGMRIVSGSWDNTIRIWDARTGQEITKPFKGHTAGVISVGFSSDGTHIVSGSLDNTIRIWDARTGEEVMKPLKGHTHKVTFVGFSPDGTRVVSGSWDKTIRIWDVNTGEEVMKPLDGHTDRVISVNFSPDGKRIVSGSDDMTIRIWDVKTGEEVMQPLKHTSGVVSVGFSSDGTCIVSGSWDKTIQMWDVSTGEAVMKPFDLGHTRTVTSVSFSPDGNRIVSGSLDKTIRLWEATTGEKVMKPLSGHTSGVLSVGFSPDGTHIVSGSYDKTIRIWCVKTGNSIMEPFVGHTSGVTSVSFSPDGMHIVSGSLDNTVRMWDARTGKEVMKPLKGHVNSVTCVGFSPDGTIIVSGSSDETIRVWDGRTGEEVVMPLEGHTAPVTSVGFSADGIHIVSGSEDRSLRIWDVRTGQQVMKPLEGHVHKVTSVSFSPDGAHIVSGSRDATIQLWDAKKGEEEDMISFEEQSYTINSVGFSPDGTRMVSGLSDNTIRLLEVRTGEEPSKGHTIPNIGRVPSFRSDLRFISLSHSNGWIRGSHQELISWVLPEWRDFVHLHPCVFVVGRLTVRFELLNYVHGLEWIRCISNS